MFVEVSESVLAGMDGGSSHSKDHGVSVLFDLRDDGAD